MRKQVEHRRAAQDAWGAAESLAQELRDKGFGAEVRAVYFDEESEEARPVDSWVTHPYDVVAVYRQSKSDRRNGAPIFLHHRDFVATEDRVVLLNEDRQYHCTIPAKCLLEDHDGSLFAIDAWGNPVYDVVQVDHRVYRGRID